MVEPPKHGAGRRHRRRATTSSWSTSRAPCTAFRWTPPRRCCSELIGGLRPSDTFNVLLFSGSNRMLAPQSVPATRANIEQALRTIEQFQRRRQHRADPGAASASTPSPRPADVSRTVVVVTDGYVTVEREAFELVRQQPRRRPTCSPSASARSVNRHLIEGLARAGMGEPFVITDPMQAPRAGRALPPHDRVARAHQREGALRGPGRVRRRAAAAARRAGRAPGDRVRQVARRGRGPAWSSKARAPTARTARRCAVDAQLAPGHRRAAQPVGAPPHRRA